MTGFSGQCLCIECVHIAWWMSGFQFNKWLLPALCGRQGAYISALCTYLHCVLLCVSLGMCSWHERLLHEQGFWCAHVCVTVPGLCVRLLARVPAPLVSAVRRGTCASLHARKSPSDPRIVCKDLRVVRIWCARACLFARTNAPPHV